MQIYSHCVTIYHINQTPHSQTVFVYPAPLSFYVSGYIYAGNQTRSQTRSQLYHLFFVQDPSFLFMYSIYTTLQASTQHRIIQHESVRLCTCSDQDHTITGSYDYEIITSLRSYSQHYAIHIRYDTTHSFRSDQQPVQYASHGIITSTGSYRTNVYIYGILCLRDLKLHHFIRYVYVPGYVYVHRYV